MVGLESRIFKNYSEFKVRAIDLSEIDRSGR